MKGIYFIVIGLSLWSCKNENMQFAQHGYLGNLSNKSEVFGNIGDSNADGRGLTTTTVPARTLYKWNGSSFVEITTQGIGNDVTDRGSYFEQFAINYKAATGKAVQVINGASGGAEFYPNADNNNWYTSGTLYAAFKTAMDNALIATGKSVPAGIFINLGVNDIRAGTSLANITLGVNSLISRLTTDYPGSPILFILVGRSEVSGSNAAAFFDMKKLIIEACETETNAHIIASAGTFESISGMFQADLLHYEQVMNNHLGTMFARWYANSSYSKWARSIIGSHFDELTVGRKSAIQSFVTTMGADLHELNAFTLFKTSDINNFYIDWTFLGYNFPQNVNYVANDYMETTGITSSSFSCGYVNSFYTKGGAGQDNFRVGTKIKTRVTAATTAAIMAGRVDASANGMRVAQASGAGTTNFQALGAGVQNGTQAEIQNATLYTVSRDGLNEYLHRNKIQDATRSLVSTGACQQNYVIGLLRTNVSSSFPFAGTFEYYFAAPYTGFDYDNFVDAAEALVAAW
jgi:hypothetical protein